MEEWYYALERAVVFSVMSKQKQPQQPESQQPRNPLHVMQLTQQQQEQELQLQKQKEFLQAHQLQQLQHPQKDIYHYLTAPHFDLFVNLAKILIPNKKPDGPFNIREIFVLQSKKQSKKDAENKKENTTGTPDIKKKGGSKKKEESEPQGPLFPELPSMTGAWFSSVIHRVFWNYCEDPNFLSIIVKTLKKKFDKITLPPSFVCVVYWKNLTRF